MGKYSVPIKDSQFVTIAKALADPTRHRMMREVRAAGELTCKQVCERFALSQPTISHHICTLATAGLISVRKRGQFHVLSIDEKVLRGFIDALGLPDRAEEDLSSDSSDDAAAALKCSEAELPVAAKRAKAQRRGARPKS